MHVYEDLYYSIVVHSLTRFVYHSGLYGPQKFVDNGLVTESQLPLV